MLIFYFTVQNFQFQGWKLVKYLLNLIFRLMIFLEYLDLKQRSIHKHQFYHYEFESLTSLLQLVYQFLCFPLDKLLLFDNQKFRAQIINIKFKLINTKQEFQRNASTSTIKLINLQKVQFVISIRELYFRKYEFSNLNPNFLFINLQFKNEVDLFTNLIFLNHLSNIWIFLVLSVISQLLLIVIDID